MEQQKNLEQSIITRSSFIFKFDNAIAVVKYRSRDEIVVEILKAADGRFSILSYKNP